MKFLYTSFLCTLLCADLQAQSMRMVAVGSSTTEGQGTFPRDSSWVNRFNEHYKLQLGMVDTTYNLGVGGYTCYKGMPSSYVPPPGRDGADVNKNITKAVNLLNGLTAPSNGVIIVNFPTNGYQTFSIAEVMVCLQTIYDSATRFGNNCYITTTQPRTDGSFNTSAMKRKLADIKDSILNRFGTAHTINFWDGMYNPTDTTILSTYSAGDNIHFNNAGHRILYERVVAKNVFGAVLATTINSFEAMRQQQHVQLQWKVQCDDPRASFVVERSGDGRAFEHLFTVKATAVGSQPAYRFTDTRVLPGKSYYRLAISERDRTSYSKILCIVNEGVSLAIARLYPVPARGDLQMEIQAIKTQPVTIRLVSATGTIIQQYKKTVQHGLNKIPLTLGSIPAGMYLVETQTANGEKQVATFTR